MGSPYSFRRSGTLCIASTYIPYNINMILLTSTCLNTFPTAVSFWHEELFHISSPEGNVFA